MHAMDAYYHRCCYVDIQNQARSHQRGSLSTDKSEEFNGAVMVHLAAHVVDSGQTVSVSELKSMYASRMEERGESVCFKYMHSTRFKEYLLHLEPDLRNASDGRDHPTLISHRSTQAAAVKIDMEHSDGPDHSAM